MGGQRAIYGLALLYSLIIGFSFLFTKVALQYADPIDTLAYRFTVSFAAIGIPVLIGRVRLQWQWRRWLRLVPIGLVYPTAFFGFQAFGLERMASSEGGIFQASVPIFTLVLASIALNEKTSWVQKLSVLCSVGGVVYILVMGGASLHGTSLAGIVMMLLSAVLLSSYNVMARFMRNGYSAVEMSFMMMLIGCICFDALAVAKHAASGTMRELFGPLAEPGFVVSILYIGLLSSLVSSLLSNYVLSKLEATAMSLFVNLGNFVSIAAGIVFLDERLAYYHIVGAALIIGGVLGIRVRTRSRAEETIMERGKTG
ncbi:DMT family transporter [Paenibacillus flagellatus]|uniref:EamA family transporter n=1 Tax=Paenibacillus flagellatus TaxID=2211139 RepID=A0A2V5KCL0_9BACL|nr:DMT family transporter [Paenibacillus flagellatus]PYI55693.1 EamA family transporter [Paenibacillus flagellatus]